MGAGQTNHDEERCTTVQLTLTPARSPVHFFFARDNNDVGRRVQVGGVLEEVWRRSNRQWL